jgi:hydroxypyruvate isomerase
LRSTTDAPRRDWKLRYAAHLGLAAPDAPQFRCSARSAGIDDQIAWLADLGFAGVQDNFLKLRTRDEQLRLARALGRHGLAMGSFNNNPASWDRPLWSATDAASRAELERELESSLELAALTGARSAVCVTGRDPARAQSAQLSAMADNLRRLADRAARAGFVLCVESVAAERFPQLLVNGIHDALEVVHAANHAAVRLQFDVAHVEMHDGGAFAHLQRCWRDVELVQVADVPGRVELGAGTLDWVAILRWIRARGYRGLIELEHEPVAPGVAGERALLERLREIDDAV